jgi:hypothetical protein
LEHLVQDLLEQVGIELFHVESRTKSIERFMQRIANPSASFRDPVNEMYDLSGVRVVLYFAEDLEKIARMVEENSPSTRTSPFPTMPSRIPMPTDTDRFTMRCPSLRIGRHCGNGAVTER